MPHPAAHRYAARAPRRESARYAAPRPSRARAAAAGVAGTVLAVSGLGAAGALPLPALGEERDVVTLAQPLPPAAEPGEAASTVPVPVADAPAPDPAVKPAATAPLPADSGSGRRVVYDIGDQQVWLVEEDGSVAHTYRVSGSRYDQVEPGSYEVYSASRHATGWHGTETMEHMVRFTRGQRAAIGFHSIPVSTATGSPIQTLGELGQPLSDGCIRQDAPDAAALYEFAPVGTTVVVTR
ncbi:MAG TPA: L,D-transpeptidase family protein [Jiangellales bacterium]|nr:L,D-transpeptidase family protein [Jiangellales bacterium]